MFGCCKKHFVANALFKSTNSQLMKTITIRTLFFVTILFAFGACKKDTDSLKSKTALLTNGTWVYDEYFRGYNSSNTTLYYKRGKSNNLLDLSPNRVTFKADGTYSEVNETGATYTGTWVFLNGETQVQVTNSLGTYTSTIFLLDEGNYHWYDQNNSNGTLGKMIHQ